MLGVVLPAAVAASSTASSWLVRNTIPTIDVVTVPTIDIRVAIVVVIVVDRDVVVTTTPPTATVAPTSTHRCSHGQSDSEGDRHPGRVVARRRIVDRRIGVRGRAVYDSRVIGWNVDNLWIRLFDNDDLLGFNNFRFYLLLLTRFQVTRALRFAAHTLHGIHDIRLLRQKCVA
jgi:hypothetical protein